MNKNIIIKGIYSYNEKNHFFEKSGVSCYLGLNLETKTEIIVKKINSVKE
jgi:hypothetical protein